jgi:hypothetical protein
VNNRQNLGDTHPNAYNDAALQGRTIAVIIKNNKRYICENRT